MALGADRTAVALLLSGIALLATFRLRAAGHQGQPGGGAARGVPTIE